MRPMMVVACFYAAVSLVGCSKKGMVTSPDLLPSSRFKVEVVDSNAGTQDATLKLNAAGQPYIVYSNLAPWAKCAARDTNGWTISSLGLARNPISADKGFVAGGFGGGPDGAARLGFSSLSGVVDETVALVSPSACAITVDASSTAAVIYTYFQSGEGYFLNTATRSAAPIGHGVWWEGWGAQSWNYIFSSVDFDSHGVLHAVYSQDGVVYYRGGNAVVGIVATAPIKNVGIAVDAQGHPQVCYVQNGELKLATEDGGTDGNGRLTFAAETVAREVFDDLYNGGKFSLQVDASGHPHIVFIAGPEAYYAIKGDGGWRIEPVGPAAFLGTLALDNQGMPHIAFMDGGGLKYATLPQ